MALECQNGKLCCHVRLCEAYPHAFPEGKRKCYKCLQLVFHKKEHVKKCRGPAPANWTCRKCGYAYPEPKENEISRLVTAHEKQCDGPDGPKAKAKAAASAKAQAKAVAPKTKPAPPAKAKPAPKTTIKRPAKAPPNPPANRRRTS